MNAIGFLLDQHGSLTIRTRLQRLAPAVRVYAVGDAEAPPKSTPDPDLLRWAEAHACLLLTNNRASMPGHLASHLARGRHVPGILQLPEQLDPGRVLEDLFLIWDAGEPEEFRDRIVYLPLKRAGVSFVGCGSGSSRAPSPAVSTLG